MNLELSAPALLFPAIAILMLGFINRYVGAATVVRNFAKDYDSNYKHTHVTEQLLIMRKRLTLFQSMISCASVALLLACLSMYLIFAEQNHAGKVSFGASLVAMMTSISIAIYETVLSNRSLNIEIQNIINKEAKSRTHE